MVMFSDIGEGSNALYCLTDRRQCCSTETGARSGQISFPNETYINEAPFSNLYLIRGFSSLLLNRRSAVGPTGIYTCLIPDSRGGLMKIYIGVYINAMGGEY